VDNARHRRCRAPRGELIQGNRSQDYPNLLNAAPQQLLDLGAVFCCDLDINGMP